jgi:hypothetical protein
VPGKIKATVQKTAWKTLLFRGSEWAALRKITTPAQDHWPVKIEIAGRQSKIS